ncbi:hypothetical protein A3F28_02670 [Candidatus Uhrbacteria bacterium RIFCSPHIGHO2_12_FULL_57_11]|uniref:HTH arsR-type domain-containing protein n=1 Tax=Candidatus Uhrbacteria bacterium RIFCSPHIGHO2_12_FULL_57_11 TaxID=1802398 RepID=A0A1F7UIJ2_9BACT|nr:MAG: hypothetical protein A3F28_02670 [Candidatus Uhrbacteria bacterium RIFCSPHIGHO2_12_FULL_57_11]
MNQNEKVLRALASRKRMDIVRLVLDRPLTVTDIAEKIKLSHKAASRHILVLAHADLLDRERVGVYSYYRVSSDLPKLARSILPHIT